MVTRYNDGSQPVELDDELANTPVADTAVGGEVSDDDPALLKEQIAAAKLEADNYRRRWQGLQAKHQKVAEERKTLRQQVVQIAGQVAETRASFHATEEERNAAKMLAQAQQIALHQQMVNEDDVAAQEESAREIILTQFSTQYGVPVEELEDFDTPQQAEKYAKKVAALRPPQPKAEVRQAQQRRAQGQDRFEGGSGGAARTTAVKPLTTEDARKAMRQLFRAADKR